jgi:hypothetical protein
MILHLTPAERTSFEQLPAALRDGSEVRDERTDALETDEQLRIRASMMDAQAIPGFSALLETVKAGGRPDLAKLEAIPDESLPEVLFTIGARGMTTLIATLLPRAASADDVAALAHLTDLRHDILEVNASLS